MLVDQLLAASPAGNNDIARVLASWRSDQIIQARVAQPARNSGTTTTVYVGSTRLSLPVQLQLPAGTNIALQVVVPGSRPVLRLIDTDRANMPQPPGNRSGYMRRFSAAVISALPQRQSKPGSGADGKLPTTPQLRSGRMLPSLPALPPLPALSNPRTSTPLATAFYVESLAKPPHTTGADRPSPAPVSRDGKAGPQQAVATRVTATPQTHPLRRGQMLPLSSAGLQAASDAGTPRTAVRRIPGFLAQVEQSLTRIQFKQPHPGRPDNATPPQWVIDLPLLIGRNPELLTLIIRGDGQHTGERKATNWQVTVAVNAAHLGKIEAQCTCRGRLINLFVWSELESTRKLVTVHLPELARRIAGTGLLPGKFNSFPGTMPAALRANAMPVVASAARV